MKWEIHTGAMPALPVYRGAVCVHVCITITGSGQSL